MFHGLIGDKAENIHLVLSTMFGQVTSWRLDFIVVELTLNFFMNGLTFQVVQGEHLNKTDRVKLFRVKTLVAVSKLYDWNGMVTQTDSKQKKDGKKSTQNKEEEVQRILKYTWPVCYVLFYYCFKGICGGQE